MKKQLIAAAVAATMTSVAMADISITGTAKANYKNKDANGTTTDTVTNEVDLVLAGSNGDSKVHVELSMDGGSSTNTEDAWLSTKVGDVSIKAGTWNPGDTVFTGNATRSTGNWILSSSVSGVKIALEGDSQKSATKTTFSGDLGGVNLKYNMKHTSDEVYASTDLSGFALGFATISADAANSDASYVTLSKELNGVTVTLADANADSSYTFAGDTSYFGDSAANGVGAGDDLTSVKLAGSVGGNKVSARFVSVDSAASTDFDVNTFQVTRPLAGGSTLEVTYTDTDKAGATNDTEVLDFELAVKF